MARSVASGRRRGALGGAGGDGRGLAEDWPDAPTGGSFATVDVAVWGESRTSHAAGGGHCSGTPALRRPSRMGSSWARYVGLSLLVVQAARARETENSGLSVRPVLIAECASSNRPSRARAAANKNCGCGLLRLASIARRNHATAYAGRVCLRRSPALAGIDPHTRRLTRRSVTFPALVGIDPERLTRHCHNPSFPALAGIDPQICSSGRTASPFPRARGDRPDCATSSPCDVSVPPRSRG